MGVAFDGTRDLEGGHSHIFWYVIYMDSAILLERFRGIESEIKMTEGRVRFGRQGRGASEGQARSEFKPDVLGRAQGASEQKSSE
jgi:hypothetical protein